MPVALLFGLRHRCALYLHIQARLEYRKVFPSRRKADIVGLPSVLDMHEDIDSLLRGRMQLYRDLHLLNGLEPRPVLIAQLLRHRSSKEWSWILEQVHSRVLHAQDGADLQASPHDQRLGRRN